MLAKRKPLLRRSSAAGAEMGVRCPTDEHNALPWQRLSHWVCFHIRPRRFRNPN